MKYLALTVFALLSLQPAFAAPEGYRYDNEWVKYEALTNTGLKPDQLKLQSAFTSRPMPKVPFGLEAPAALKDKKGALKKQQVSITLAEEENVARKQTEIRFGFPLPKGGIFSDRHVVLKDSKGTVVPAQYTTTSRWTDQSVKWVLITTHAQVGAKDSLSYTVEAGEDVNREDSKSGLTYSDKGDTLEVVTGPLKVEINKKKFNLFQNVWIDQSGNNRFEDNEKTLNNDLLGVKLTRQDGVVFTTSQTVPDAVEVEESGPERIVVRVKGKYASATGEKWQTYTTRMIFHVGSSEVTVFHTHLDDDITKEFIDVKSLTLDFNSAKNFTSATTDYVAEKNDKEDSLSSPSLSVFQADDTKSEWTSSNGKKNGGRSEGCWSVQAGNASTGFIMHNFWQRWPKGFDVQGNKVSINFLPVLPSKTFGSDLPYYLMFPFVEGNYRMKWGMSFTERFTVDFSGKASLAELKADTKTPLVAVIPANWYEQTQALGYIPAPQAEQFKVWDTFVETSFKDHRALSEKQREYGFFNYGDWFGERKRNWGNNEYDFAHCFFQQFARTGITAYYRQALLAAQHQADVDIVHAYPDPYYVGANHQHSIGHTGTWQGPKEPKQATWSHAYDDHTDANNGHTWSHGMADAWFLTGDARVMESVIELGEHITWAMSPKFTKLGTHERSAGWSLRAILGIYQILPDEAYLKAASRIANVAMDLQTKDNGGAWAHKLPADHTTIPDGFGNNTFIIGILLNGLVEYHIQTNDPRALESLEYATAWLARSWRPEVCAWPYSATPDGKPAHKWNTPGLTPLIANSLAYIGMKTKNRSYMDMVEKSMERTFLFTHSQPIGKELAELMVYTPETFGFVTHYENSFTDKTAALTILSGQGVSKVIMNTPEKDTFSARGPAKKTFYAKIKNAKSSIIARRTPFGSSNPTMDTGSITVTNSKGEMPFKQVFPTKGKQDIPLEITGNAGDVFKIVIEDDITAVWDLDSDSAQFVIEAKGIQFGDVYCQRFTFSVPEGISNFTVKISGIHVGTFGALVTSPDGKTQESKMDSRSEMGVISPKANPNDGMTALKIQVPKDQTGKNWTLIMWASGDIVCTLDGVPPYLAIHANDFFDPKWSGK